MYILNIHKESQRETLYICKETHCRKHVEKQIDTIKYEEKQKGIYIYIIYLTTHKVFV